MEFSPAVKRFVSWHRRALAAVLAGLAVVVLALRLAPAQAPGTQVVVTARALAAGHVVEGGDVRVVALPPASVPEGDLPGLADVLGVTVGARVEANTVLQRGLLVTSAEVGDGRALVPISVSDEQIAGLLAPGHPVSLVHAGVEFEILTDDARVAALPPTTQQPGLAAGAGRAPLVLLDVPEQVAAKVSALGQRGELTVILGGG